MSRISNYINKNYSFIDECHSMGIEVHLHGNTFCMFHENNNTPSAKFYEDSNSLYCFSCGRKYSVYDLWKVYCPEKIKFITSNVLIGDEYSDGDSYVPKVNKIVKVNPTEVEDNLHFLERIKIAYESQVQ